MKHIQGIFDGKDIKPLEQINAKPNSKVVITYIEDTSESQASFMTQEFLQLAGTWEDERTCDEIIEDIYSHRTASSRDVIL